MNARLTRRIALAAPLVLLAGACAQGKLVLTVLFETPRAARAGLDAAIGAFALAQRFKVAAEADPGPGWPLWRLTSEDIDISFLPHDDAPVDEGAAIPEGPLVYAARFYDHSPTGSARLTDVAAAFARAAASVEGVRKLGQEQHA